MTELKTKIAIIQMVHEKDTTRQIVEMMKLVENGVATAGEVAAVLSAKDPIADAIASRVASRVAACRLRRFV
jgi:hypothetical protein